MYIVNHYVVMMVCSYYSTLVASATCRGVLSDPGPRAAACSTVAGTPVTNSR
jgi:hypothetical protein